VGAHNQQKAIHQWVHTINKKLGIHHWVDKINISGCTQSTRSYTSVGAHNQQQAIYQWVHTINNKLYISGCTQLTAVR